MSVAKKLGLSGLGLAAILLSLHSTTPAHAQGTTRPTGAARPVRIGMVDSLFTDVPSGMRVVGQLAFGELMKQLTGMEGKMGIAGEAMNVAKKVNDGDLDLGVFHGVEFAWAQQRYPNLRPLMVAITKHQHAQAVVVVRKGGPITKFAELKARTFALPLCSREHCRLFLKRNCRECGQVDPHVFFKQLIKPGVEKALDDVCADRAQAVVVDRVALEHYEALKPGCRARLQVLKHSELFPSGVIAYREGSLSPAVLTKFRVGLLKAGDTVIGRELISVFGITSFETVPQNYQQDLANIVKVYPAPR